MGRYPSSQTSGGGGSASDATTSFTDVTTNDVTSTKHGYAPKSPGDASKFLDGAATPAWVGTRLAYCLSAMNGARTNVANGGIIVWDTDIVDASNLHSIASNTGLFVANATGVWRLTAMIRRTSGSAGDYLAIQSTHSGDTGNYSRDYFTTTGVETAHLEWESTLTSAESLNVVHAGSATNNYGGDGGGTGEYGWARFERVS